jgi:phosphoenolpyruvate synthase/pyruvate phosphate dikinase
VAVPGDVESIALAGIETVVRFLDGQADAHVITTAIFRCFLRKALAFSLQLVRMGLVFLASPIKTTAREWKLTWRELVHQPGSTLPDDSGTGKVVALGIAASPGVARGLLTLDSHAATDRASKNQPVIYVSNSLDPGNINGVVASVGIITLDEGSSSMPAERARRMRKPCVCKAEITVDTTNGMVTCGPYSFRDGDEIAIDGARGTVLVANGDN